MSLYRLARALPVVSVLPQTELNVWTHGYAESTVYDVSNLGGLGTDAVSAIIFDVQCREIRGLKQAGNVTVAVRGDGTRSVTYPVRLDASLRSAGVSPGM